jgi:hypothetical protein
MNRRLVIAAALASTARLALRNRLRPCPGRDAEAIVYGGHILWSEINDPTNFATRLPC